MFAKAPQAMIAFMLRQFHSQAVEPGDILYRYGDDTDAFYFVGKVSRQTHPAFPIFRC